jgi:tetratricopeptide (TPR) repeat protein
MGIFDAAKSAYNGNRAYHLHVDANKLAGEGKVAQAKEKFQAALKLYDEAERQGNLAPNILQAYTLLLMREDEFEKARALMEGMSKRKGLSDAEWTQLRLQYSIYLWHTGQLDRAIETMQRAAAKGMNGSIYGTLGMYWVDKARQTGEFGPALDFNREAMDYDDEDASTLDNMGQLYEAMAEAEGPGGQADAYRAQARDYYKKALKQKPRQITTIYYLARMLHREGDDAGARKLLSVKDTLYISAICPVTREMIDALAAEIG